MTVVKANSSDIDLLARYLEPKVKEIVLLHGTDQSHTGRFKLHCFYEPTGDECSNVYNTFKFIPLQ